MPVYDAVVVGGGISGLSAAYELQRHGLSVRVLEADARPGGLILTERFDGWTIDAGPDSLLIQKPAAVSLCRELGIADRLHPTLTPRTSYVLRDGHLHPLIEGSFLGFPVRFSALMKSTLFTWTGKARMAMELIVPRRVNNVDESLAAFVRRRFGNEAADYLAEPLLAGIHAGNAERLSACALFPRLVEAERRSGSVLRTFRSLHVRPSPQGAFVSLPGGIGELIERLVASLDPGTVMLSTRATELRRAGTFEIDCRQPVVGRLERPDPNGVKRPALNAVEGPVRGQVVILAVPAYVAAGLLRSLDPTAAGLCDAIPYASTATVALGYQRRQIDHPLIGTGFVVPRVERQPLLAATWVTSKWPGRAPVDHVLLRGFLGGARDPSRLERSDEELVETVREELTDLLHISGDPLFHRLYRWTRQSPQYEVGHLERVASIERRLASVPGLFVTGGGFRAIGIPDCIADGRETAARAAQFLATKVTKPNSPSWPSSV